MRWLFFFNILRGLPEKSAKRSSLKIEKAENQDEVFLTTSSFETK